MTGNESFWSKRHAKKIETEHQVIVGVEACVKSNGFRRSGKSLVKRFENGNLGVIAFQSISGSDAALRPTVNLVSRVLAETIHPHKKPAAADCHATEFLSEFDQERKAPDPSIDYSVYRCVPPESADNLAALLCRLLQSGGLRWIEDRVNDDAIVVELRKSGPVQQKWAKILESILSGSEPDVSILEPSLPFAVRKHRG